MTAGIVACPSCAVRNRVPTTASGTPRCAKCHADLPWLVDATDSDFGPSVNTAVPVLVDLWAPWCGPCRLVAPAIQRASNEFAGRLKVVKVNVDESPGVAARFGVQGIPTLLLLRDGQVVSHQIGALAEPTLLTWIRDSLQSMAASGRPRSAG